MQIEWIKWKLVGKSGRFSVLSLISFTSFKQYIIRSWLRGWNITDFLFSFSSIIHQWLKILFYYTRECIYTSQQTHTSWNDIQINSQRGVHKCQHQLRTLICCLRLIVQMLIWNCTQFKNLFFCEKIWASKHFKKQHSNICHCH